MCLHQHTLWEHQELICTDCGLILCTDVYSPMSPVVAAVEEEDDNEKEVDWGWYPDSSE